MEALEKFLLWCCLLATIVSAVFSSLAWSAARTATRGEERLADPLKVGEEVHRELEECSYASVKLEDAIDAMGQENTERTTKAIQRLASEKEHWVNCRR